MRSVLRAALTALVSTMACVAGAGSYGDFNEVSFLQGSWTGSVTIRNCVSGEALSPPLLGITTFHQGGTLSESRQATPVTSRGPGHGIWYRSGKREFRVKIVFQRFDVNGFLLGTQEILSTNTLSSDSKTAVITATAKVIDVNGVTLATACASGESQRMEF